MFKIYFLIPLLIPLALVRRDISGGVFHRFGRWAGRLAVRPARAIVLVGIISLALTVGLSLAAGIPVPHVADEFGYLLMGDTFAHGRMTNPTPPLWEHFETIHEIMQPTYTAKYPPAQGLALAVGELLGLPIIGVWLTTALACMAICWMLMAWMPPRWALYGGLMAALHPLILEWSQKYWGGAVALGGGALVLGSFRRMLDRPRVWDSVWMGVGLGILANSRPYEGLLLGLLVLLALAIRFIMMRNVSVSVIFRRLVVPLVVILILTGAQIGLYNWSVTGKPVEMPYMVHEQTYGIAPVFLFGTPRRELEYRHPEIRRFQQDGLNYFNEQRHSLEALARATGGKIWTLAQGYLWSCLMLVALLGLPWALKRERWLRWVLLMGLIFCVGVLMSTWVLTHYAAPAAGILFVLAIQSMRNLYAWHVGSWRWGRNIVRGLAVLLVISYFHLGFAMRCNESSQWYLQRQAILENLRHLPGKSLIVVKYDPNHNPHREWVYNEADIVHAKVILAQDMGPEKNKELLDFYRDRKIWLLRADVEKPELEVYPRS
jgi:hypothetical protein